MLLRYYSNKGQPRAAYILRAAGGSMCPPKKCCCCGLAPGLMVVIGVWAFFNLLGLVAVATTPVVQAVVVTSANPVAE